MSKPKTITITVTESGENNIDISVNCDVSLKVMDMIRVVDSVSEVNVKKLKEFVSLNEITDMEKVEEITFKELKS